MISCITSKVVRACALLAFLTPATAHTGTPAETLKVEVEQAVGPKIEVVIPEGDYSLNAGFWAPGIYCDWFTCFVVNTPTISFVGNWSKADPEVRRLVAYHELGHYLQWTHGWAMDEWEADVYAANRMCLEGHDGLQATYRAARLLLTEYGDSWAAGHDDPHGAWGERLANVTHKALACRRYLRQEAPFARTP